MTIDYLGNAAKGATVTAKPGRAGQRKKGIGDVVSYAVSHPTRIHVLVVLHHGTYTAAQIAQIIDEPLNNVSNHIRELVDAGSIEIARTEQKGNIVQHYYRGVEMPFYTDEDVAAMTPQQRQVSAGLVVQSMAAEAMAALRTGKLVDPRVWLTWHWFNVDEQGRRDIADEQQRCWNRMQEIEAESVNRRAESGEEATTMIVTQMSYERARKPPTFRPS
jgi:DNA-binding transcriptional ArsR family regulator